MIFLWMQIPNLTYIFTNAFKTNNAECWIQKKRHAVKNVLFVFQANFLVKVRGCKRFTGSF